MATRLGPLPVKESLRDITAEVARVPLQMPARVPWLIALILSLALLALFLGSITYLFARGVGVWGLNIPVNWAFAIHLYVWWLGLGHAGTLISAMLLLMGQDWRNSLNRFAEAMTVCAVICAGMEPIIHLGRPWFLYWMFPYPATMGVWPQFRSPLEWDVWAVMTYLIVSILFWYIGLVPDLATVRDRTRKRGWQVFFGIFALGWRGSARHWAVWNKTYRTIAAIAVPLVVSVHSEVSLLFAAGQIPGWHSTIFPPYFVLGAAYSGFAMVAMIAIVMRHTFQLKQIVTERHLDVLAKVTLAMGLMTAYGYVFEIFDGFYSGDVHEIATIHDRFFGIYAWSFWGAVIFNFVPIQGLWFDRVRRNPVLLFLISTSVVVGMWLERYMILVTSLYKDFLPSSFGHYTPTFWDWSTYIGMLGLFMTPFLLFVRFLPSISIFEDKEVLAREKAEAAHA
ncbi:MAG: NrfD/PsrC family molybdoenzyme membrane anchor subunit [Sphingomicrobium sp.]